MADLGDMRDLGGISDADVQTFYAQAKAAYAQALLGAYQVNGRVYTPAPPDKYLNLLARLGNEILRRQVQPAPPDIGLMQVEFGDANPTTRWKP